MLSLFTDIIRNSYPDLAQRNVYLAISGGKDSMCLSHLLLALNINHTLLHVNFKLRGAESDEDENFLRKYASQNKLAIKVKSFNTKIEADKANLTIQETARNLRYSWFYEIILRDEQNVLLTAHHADDSVETFFINLIRGTGLKGLTGINSKKKQLYRPLITIPQDLIMKYVKDHNIIYRQDISNYDNKYLRNNLRNNLIPQFENIESSFKTKVNQTINSLSEIHSWISSEADCFLAKNLTQKNTYSEIAIHHLTGKQPIFIEFALSKFGIHKSNRSTFIKFLTAKQGALFYTDGYEFLHDRSKLCIRPIGTVRPLDVIIDTSNLPKTYATEQYEIKLSITKEKLALDTRNMDQLNADKIKFPIRIRRWQQGDKIRPLGMLGKKLVSDILINKKVNRFEKDNILVLEDNSSTIISILGIVIANDYKLNSDVNKILRIEFF